MTFKLVKEEDGYPPAAFETLWVEPLLNGSYRIDNVPFYAYGVSPDDVVTGKFVDSILFYGNTVSRSSSSVIRIVFYKKTEIDRVLEHLIDIGCRWEGSDLENLYSVEVPQRAILGEIQQFLIGEAEKGYLDYEEACLRSG